MPRIQAFEPGTRVTTEGKPSTSRVSSRATRKFSALMRNATPTHSRSLPASRPWPVKATRASRSSSISNSNGLSRSDLRVALAVIVNSVRAGSTREGGLRLLDQLFHRHRLHQVVDRALAHAPDAIGLLVLRG